MSSIYKGVLTNNGKALIAQATTANRVGFSHIAIGDGNGSVPTPTDTRTALVRERHRLALNSVNINPNNRNQIICEAIIPSNVGGWTIRELGLYAGSTMLVHSNYPATYKPTQTEGGARELVIRMVINVQSADVIALTLNDSLVYATREWTETNFVNHNEVINNLTSTEINKPLSANQGKILNDNKVAKTATITAGNGLTGGGDLSANRSLTLGTPSQITATSSNSVTADSHSHAIDKASTTVAGIVQLNDSLTSTSNTQALTANQGKILQDTKANKAGETFTGRVKATDFIAPRWRSAEPISLFRETSNDAQQLYTGGLLISNNYADNTHIPAHGIYAKGQIKTDAGFIGNLTGNSASATQLQNPRTINGVAFDGTQNITIADNTKVAKSGDSMTGSLNLLADNTMINVGNNDDIAIIKKSGLGGAIAFGANNRFRVYKSNNARVSPSDTLTQVFEVDTNGFATANKFIGTLQGNADTSTRLQTPRTINGVSFDGTQNIEITELGSNRKIFNNDTDFLKSLTKSQFTRNDGTASGTLQWSAGIYSQVHDTFMYICSSHANGRVKVLSGNNKDRPVSSELMSVGLHLNNTLTSTATDKALTAAQGKILNESKIDKVDVRIAKANVDVNTYKNDGNYAFFYGALNLPFSGSGKLQVISGNNGNYITQIAYPFPSESNEVYIRSQTAYNEGFSTWKRLDGADWNDVRNKPTASLTQAGITQLNSAVNSSIETQSATPKAVKTAYDKAVEAEKKALPIGSVVAFPKEISNPVGFLLCNGTNFAQATYPDLYRALGNKTKLPQLTRSDVGQLSYFPSDIIPDGWLECNGQTISQTVYPELYAYLGNKYGTNGKLPDAEDRFIRNASNGLTVGQKQKGTLGIADGLPYPSTSSLIQTADGSVDASIKAEIMGADPLTPNYGDYTFAQDANTANAIAATWTNGAFYLINNRDGKITHNANGEIMAYIHRPKSIVFKLCIKARNSFDDVQFWIKAYGEVVNVGQLDASKLANDLRNHTHTVAQISDFAQGVRNLIQRKNYSATLTPTHNSFRTQTVNITGSVEVLPDGRIIQRFTFVCPVIYFYRYGLSAFYREKLGVTSFVADDTPLLELPLWTAMPNKVQEARIHLSSNLNHNAFGEALEWAYDWDSIFNQHVNIKDKAYFAFRRWGGSQDEPVTFNIVVEGY